MARTRIALRIPMTARTVDVAPDGDSPRIPLRPDDAAVAVAVAVVAAQVGHRAAERPAAAVMGPLLQVFFAILWAWMNFTGSLVRQR